MKKTRPVKTYYLEMFARPNLRIIHRNELLIFRASHISLPYYRLLYEMVGEDIGWVDRLMLTDAELEDIIYHEKVNLYVVYKDGKPGGFAELDERVAGEIKINYFGIKPDWRGKGIGKYFLYWIIRQAWMSEPMRLWLHTCELDHPAALHTYLKAGFSIFDEKVIEQQIVE